MSDASVPSAIEVWVTTPVSPEMEPPFSGFDESGDVERHANPFSKWREATKVDSGQFLESWTKAFEAVEAIFTAGNSVHQQESFRLESVSAKLSLTASGKVAFVGELGGEVAFEVTFKRHSHNLVELTPHPSPIDHDGPGEESDSATLVVAPTRSSGSHRSAEAVTDSVPGQP